MSPAPAAGRDPSAVPVTLITDVDGIDGLADALRAATRVAIDTETPITDDLHRAALRVLSAAVRLDDGTERAFVVDARDVPAPALADALDGVVADGWNADFDAGVLDRAVYPDAPPGRRGPRWWDAQLADALLHQGMSGFSFFHGLAWATERYLGVTAEGKGSVQLSYTATDDLSSDQIAYAAADAVETLWVGDVLRRRLTDAGLDAVARLEMDARPFLDVMTRAGLPVDWAGWEVELERLDQHRRGTLTRLAELTGGGQGSLFSDDLEPSWNPLSERDVREQLNTHQADHVRAWTKATHGRERLLQPTDPIRRDNLAEIGGPVATALLDHRDVAKVLNTYGTSLVEHQRDDGRLHPEYLQVVGTNTGRLASRNPNAQNLTPRLKPYLRPGPGRVFAYADLSQAELRYLAQVSGDEALRQAFARGEDVHVSTAARMFGVDMAVLASDDPAAHAGYRARAKTINFGIAYGQRGRALARSLTQAGVETSEDEGRRLLDAYLAAYPGVARWADERDRFIDRLSREPGTVDWDATLRLHRWFRPVNELRRELRTELFRWPTPAEVHEAMPDGPDRPDVGEVAWVAGYEESVVLQEDGTPWGFSSRTPAGRRQQFNLHAERLLATAAVLALRSPDADLVRVRDEVGRRTGAAFTERGEPRSAAALEKILEDRTLRRAVIDAVGDRLGPGRQRSLLERAMADRVGVLANAYRNAPIQGGVADVMLAAYHRLHDALVAVPGAVPVQTVHDSVVVECDAADGERVARLVQAALEDAMAEWCPDVRPAADADVRRSLADADVVTVIPPSS